MTQSRFVASDPDTLRVSAQIIRNLAKQIRTAQDPDRPVPQHVYGALASMAETTTRLQNWADALETGIFAKFLRENV